jgi:uncharacterized spore protein YtfJ
MKVDEMMKGTQDAMTVGRVYGEAFEREGATFIPVANVSGGGGGGGDETGNSGGGFGVMASPAGMFVIRGGEATWKPAVNVNRIVMGAQIVAIVALLAVRSILKSRK